ncbi:hypothetical protein OWR29_22125 [Actinoplanes sp. Pm04-4]|uniref:Uncharacterized protein n=1 Tax=Paractinoplanes pyxinae TaxID=2997416 RepID=A0ABT4B2H7_9ACTN|nr:hypothetical protein [Actinoplanes pyxinae]MCY1140704.1 hypothetical protein [Actinoplanes pyxinae]
MTEPVLTSSWCTAWDSFNTPRIWSMVMNEDDALAREQVLGWRRLASSIRSQHQALSTAKADLMAAWPPDKNASAEAFLNELDRLMVRLEAASADADTTATGLDRILNALDGAKKAIEPLWEKYKDKSDDLVPRWFDGAEDELDVEARNHMITMERAVSDAVADLKVPDKFEFRIEGTHEWPPRPQPGGEGGPGTGSARLGSGGVSPSVPHDPVPPLPGLDPVAPDIPVPGADGSDPGGVVGGPGAVVRPGGPDLAGVINPPATLPGLGEPGAAGPLPGGAPPVAGVPPVVPGLLPGGGPVGGGGVGRPPIGGAGRGPVAGRTLPSGAVIGGPGGVTGRGIGGPGGVGGRGIGGPGGLGGRGIGGPGSIGGPGVGGRGAGGAGAAGGRGVGGPGAGGGRGVGGVGEPGARGVGGVGGPGVGGGRGVGGVGGPGAAGGRGPAGRAGAGARPGVGSFEGEPGRGGVGRGAAGGPTLGGVGGPGAGIGRGAAGGLRGPGAARGRSGGRRGSDEDIRPGGASVEGFAGGAGKVGAVGGPLGGPVGGARAGSAGAGGGRGAARAPRPAWLPDDPVGPDRHLAAANQGGRGQGRPRTGDGPTGFDPDNLWQVAEGVAPVINPGVDDDWHDPGPNVIGRRG